MSSHTSHYPRRHKPDDVVSSSHGAPQTRLPVSANAVSQRARGQPGQPAPSLAAKKGSAQTIYRGGELRESAVTVRPARNVYAEEGSSGLPRASSSLSTVSRDTPSNTRLLPRPALSARPNTSHSIPRSLSISGKERPRNVLSRKAPSVEKQSLRKPAKSDTGETRERDILEYQGSMSVPGGYRDPYPGSILGITMPATTIAMSNMPAMSPRSRLDDSGTTQIPREFAGLAPAPSSQHLPPPPSLIASTGSPSTRYSDSPGPWSSRTSTPTSMSSYSPGIVQTSKIGGRQRPVSPTRSRPPVIRRKVTTTMPEEKVNQPTQGLSALRESLGSSSSGSTVRDDRIAREIAEKRKKKRLSPPPPSPPPRKSSMKFKSPKKGERSDTSVEQKSAGTSQHVDTGEPRPKETQPLIQESTTVDSGLHARPARPSREGTEDLDVSPSPVIQSNLSPLQVVGHRRRTSADSQIGAYRNQAPPTKTMSPNPAARPPASQPNTQIPSRQVSPSPRALQSPQLTSPSLSSKSQETALSHRKQGSKDSKDSSSAGSSKLSSRFGFFGKRSKTPTEVGKDQSEKVFRKGPAAGTGHEGYGKYAQRGRRTSVGSTGGSSRGRSNSTSNSVAGSSSSRKGSVNSRTESDIDDFLAQRLEPIVITGGGQVKGRRDSDTATDQSSISSTLSVDSIGQSKQSQRPTFDSGYKSGSQSSTKPQASYTSPPAYLSGMTTASPERIGDVPIPTLAARRSLHRSQHFDGEALRLPAPINTSILGPPPSLDSYDTSRSSIPQTDSTLPPVDDVFMKREIKSGKKPEKRGRTLRWNFFQRTPEVERHTPPSEPGILNVTEMPATIARIPALRPIAHYAMLDPEDQDGSDTLEDLLQRVEDSPPKEHDIEDVGLVPQGLGLRRQHGQSVLLPSPPSLLSGFSAEARPASPRVFLHREQPHPPAPAEPASIGEGRPRRLQQVGRIPQVVSKRDRQHKPAVQSFSRPFVRSSTQAPPPVPAFFEEPSVQHERPSLGIQTDVLPSRPFPDFDSAKPASAPEPASDVVNFPTYREFLVFPPRKASTVSGSSSSEGVPSFAASNAILPEPAVKNVEDEVWNEYDDLIDHVMSPSPPKSSPKKIRSTSSSQGDPFTYATAASENLQTEIYSNKKDSMALDTPVAPVQTSSVVFPSSLASDRSSDSVRLRRSRILSALGSTIAPDTPISIGEIYAGYGERNRSSANLLNRESTTSSAGRTSFQSTLGCPPSISTSTLPETTRHRNTVLLDIAERDRNGPIAQSNLRFGALMTSRWLSFGRVLFSPAHTIIKENRDSRVLVLDGLGNDDWSFYCALTYPTAHIYSLSATPAPATSRRGSTAAWQAPPNHRTIHHPNMSQPFPFPKGFFAVCVFRFPAATSDAALRSAISECKRVLRPGGYIEMSILDLDMMNMGNRTRRAVRDLKVRMSVAEPDVNLKPASDHIQSLLGRKGFENLNRCVVGVPVAGRVVGSRDSNSSTSHSSAADVPQSSGGMSTSTPATTTTSSSGRRRRYSPLDDEERNFSLSDVMSDHSPASDEHITKMVARVGRWWYTRCYEWAVLPDGDLERSIWADRRVLRECEQRGSGFKLLIAYAQKPFETRRRTVSEPSQPVTPAIVGL